MIGYTTVGTNDLAKSAQFYDELLAQIGAKRTMDFGTGYAWTVADNHTAFSVMQPHDKNEATAGNGTMIAIAMQSPEQVDAFYQKAMELGAQCEGPAGPRGSGFYAGYFRDLDGNKLNAFCMTESE